MTNKLYVAHDCRNSRLSECDENFCNNRWIDEDVTGANLQIPTWKYCKECCEKMGIDFDKQKPSDYRTKEQNERLKKFAERNKERFAKWN